ncbi:MAG: MFS transporter [Anaerolineae bacterium]|nr:MFS transporter [Anaerolineae bacterium]
MTSLPSIDPRLRRWQWRIFGIAWLSYASFYLCRVNIAVALPLIQVDLGWDRSAVGAIGSVFLWVYAIGQLVNGTLGQKANARWFVGAGMLLSAACSAAFGASSALWVMIALWGLNGWAQSMGWAAIMKTIAAWFDPRRRGRITAFFSPCFVLGHLVAWAVGGWLVSRWGWRYAFWLPALFFAGVGGLWLVGVRSTPQAVGFSVPRSAARSHVGMGEILRSLLAHPRLRWAAVTCVFASMIKDGLNLWAPTFLVDALDMPVSSAALAASVLPLFGLAGSLLAGWLSDRLFRSHEAPGIIGLSLVVGLAMIGFMLSSGTGSWWIAVVLLGVCGMAVYGINALLLTSIPLSFSEEGSVAAVAGFLDFASYIGGGISALAAGRLLDGVGWNAVFGYWLAATLVAAASATVLFRRTQPRNH